MTGHAVVWCSTKELSENFKHTFELWHKIYHILLVQCNKIQQWKSEQSHQKYNIHMLFLLSMGWQKFCLQLALEKKIFKMKDLHLHVNIICKFWKTNTNKHYLSLGVLSGTVSILVLSAKEEKHFPDLKWSSVMRDITYNKFKKLNSIKWVTQTLHENDDQLF